jgi:LysR family nitrogen assimilation transcriptional regulator
VRLYSSPASGRIEELPSPLEKSILSAGNVYEGKAMDFIDLHAFAVVARLQSFSRAATQLRIAQSALSRRVQRLEYKFGTKLLERHARGAAPTEAGVILLQRVEWLESELEKLQHDMLTVKDGLTGDIKLVLPHGVIQFLVSSIIERYHERCPDVKLHISEGKSSSNYDAVVNGAVDAAMLYNPKPASEISVLPLYFERLLVVGPIEVEKDTALIRNMESYPATKLHALPLILPSRPDNIRLAVENLANKFGVTLNMLLEVDGLSNLKTLVKKGLGYTILSNGPVHLDIIAGSLVAIPIADPSLEFSVGLVHRKDRCESPPLKELIAVIRDIMQGLTPTSFWRPAEHLISGNTAQQRGLQPKSPWPEATLPQFPDKNSAIRVLHPNS